MPANEIVGWVKPISNGWIHLRGPPDAKCSNLMNYGSERGRLVHTREWVALPINPLMGCTFAARPILRPTFKDHMRVHRDVNFRLNDNVIQI